MSTAPDGLMRPTWVEIDLPAFDRNLAAIVSRLPADSQLIAVLKADGYGHGALELAKRCSAERVAMIATALLEEALELRRGGITLPLLVLGGMNEAEIRLAAAQKVTIGLPGPETVAAACEVAREREVRAHLKLDSGMGRVGVTETELPDVVEMIRSVPNLCIDAIYTHYANADDAKDPFTEEQGVRFRTLLQALKEAGIEAPRHHSANSAATLRGIVAPSDYVRVGLALYGADPFGGESLLLEPVMRWRSEITRLKELPPGHAVGYGTTFHTTRASRIATLPVGYADGYNRLLSNRGEMLVRGRRAPLVGRVSMDLVTIDVTDIPGAGVGDEAILLGAQGADRITAEEIANRIGTISYEVFCSVSARVPRIYRDGDVMRVRSRFA